MCPHIGCVLVCWTQVCYQFDSSNLIVSVSVVVVASVRATYFSYNFIDDNPVSCSSFRLSKFFKNVRTRRSAALGVSSTADGD